MNKTRFTLLANAIFLFHVALVAIILFGWMLPSALVYRMALIVTLLSELLLGYCPLTKWEFSVRKILNPGLDYDYSFFGYYGHKIAQQHISPKLIRYLAIIFLSLSLVTSFIRLVP